MAVDTTLRFGRYNSYELAAGEELWSSKFDVELYSQIAIQLQAVRLANTATGQLIVRWIKADGSKLPDSTKTISVTTKWTREAWVLDVPTGAVKAMWAVKNTHASRVWNFACGMVEPGPVAGAFDPAFANQVSLLTASGLYTGTVTADQVVTGLLQATDGRAYFDLDKPEIVMQGESTVWKASPENPLRVENKDGELLGGLVNAGGQYLFVSRGLATSDSPDYFLKAGDIYRGEFLLGCGIRAYHKSNTEESLAEIALMSGPAIVLQLDDSMLYITEEPMPYNFYYTYTHPTTHDMLLFTGESDWGWEIGHYPYSGGGGALGVDATGPYYTVNNEQSRLNSVNLSAGTNLNTVTVPGVYYTGSSAQTNKPSGAGDYAMLQVIKNSATFITQFYVDGSSDAWVRRMHSGTWAAWKKLT